MSRAAGSTAVGLPQPSLRRVIRGERILLRYPTAQDRGEFLSLKRASRAFLEPWESTPPDGSDPFSAAAFDRLLKTRRSDVNHRFLICLCEAGDKRKRGPVIGQISLSNIVRGGFQSCYVGYWIGHAYAGRGYMTEALTLALGFAFDDLALHRVEANIIPRNRPSLGLVQKLGFRYEGTAKRYLRIRGRWQDHEHWAMTREEWPPTRNVRPRRTSMSAKPATSRSRARSRAST